MREKLKEFKLKGSEEHIDLLLQYIQVESQRLKRNITDRELLSAWEAGYGRKDSIC